MAKKNKDIDSKAVGTKALDLLFPARKSTTAFEERSVDLPATAAGYFDGFLGGEYLDPVKQVFSATSENERLIHSLPIERIAKYPFLEAMSKDPTIDSGIKMHIANALSATSDTGEIIKIESTGENDDPVVVDLRDTFKEIINKNAQEWAYTCALLGCNYVRVYGEQGKGVTHVRSDFYTHPRYMREFERAGQLAGYTCAYQQGGSVRLMEPWKFVAFKVPYWRRDNDAEPYKVDSMPVDLASDDWHGESIVETQHYGTSLIETSYGPWFDLLEAVLSLNMSRKNAARLERVIGVNTGKLDPVRASKYLSAISGNIKKANKDMAEKSLRTGFVQTVLNHIIPIWGDTRGRLDINTVQGTPDIQGIEDVMFHVKRLGSALGIDPALLGFGDLIAGGLGEGGWFRMSILASIKAQMLRRAIKSGLERLFDIHVAYKYGKVFLAGEKPWRINFNSVSSALEREERENLEGRSNLALALAGLVPTIDQEMSTVDKRAYANFLFTDILKVEEEKFAKIFPESLKNAKPEGDEECGAFESAGEVPEHLKTMIYDTISEFYGGENEQHY